MSLHIYIKTVGTNKNNLRRLYGNISLQFRGVRETDTVRRGNAEIKKETAVKVLLRLALNAAYIVQAAVMARPSRVRLHPCADFTHSAFFR